MPSKHSTTTIEFALAAGLTLACGAAQAAQMPKELHGEYTHAGSDACGYLRVTAKGFGTNEDLACTVTKIRDGNDSLEGEFICQIDDPKKIGVSGTLKTARLGQTEVLAMSLRVTPKDRARASLPPPMLFAKCEKK
jgi:hypothetical protein